MSRNIRIKLWRKHAKDKMIEAMGGKCACCGYDKCRSVLSFHHINKKDKDKELNGIIPSIISWRKIVKELKKCVLLCSNCHGEVHAGVLFIPKKCKKFDKRYEDYKMIERDLPKVRCLMCGKDTPIHRQVCSKKCQGAMGGLGNRKKTKMITLTCPCCLMKWDYNSGTKICFGRRYYIPAVTSLKRGTCPACFFNYKKTGKNYPFTAVPLGTRFTPPES